MRDYLILAVVFSGAPIALRFPWVGMLYFYWISLMNPHKLAWGMASQFNIAAIVAIATIVGFIFSNEEKRFSYHHLLGLMMLLWVHFTITTITAFNPEAAWVQWQKVSKIFLMSILTIPLFKTRERLGWMTLVIVFSLGFYGVKGGVFTIITGGEYLVWGPAGSFIRGNNELGLALNMLLPFLFFEGMDQTKKILRHAYFAAFLLSIVAIIGTRSRGAVVGLVFVILAILLTKELTTNQRIIGIFVVGTCIVVGLLFAPQMWFDRMATIQDYKQDASAIGRINAWGFAHNLAKARPIVGGGFESFTPELFLQYAPNPQDVHDAHSVLFEVLAEHGYVGVGIYLAILLGAWITLGRLAKISRGIASFNWAMKYVLILRCSIVAYVSSGLTLGLAYFDFFWLLIAMTICLTQILRNQVKAMGMKYFAQNRSLSSDANPAFTTTQTRIS